jgi:transposase-like protein
MVERPDACPACCGSVSIKSGHACGRQRWRCKGCGRQFTRITPRGKPVAMKHEAVGLYCMGLSLNAIGTRLGVSGPVGNFVCERAWWERRSPDMPRRKEPKIPDALLDQLLAGADPKTAFDPNGLLDGLKKALAERALNAEMDHHLTGSDGANSRNGYGRKTIIAGGPWA